MPSMISERDEFDLEYEKENRESTRSFLAGKPTKLQLGHWQNLLQVGNTIRLIDNGETLYHVKFEIQHKGFWPHIPQAVQVEVWRQRGSTDITHGLPKTIFFDYFLKKYNAIFSDDLHTEDGKRFWQDRLVEAFKMNYAVYYGDYASRKLSKIDNRQELTNSYYDVCWGKQPVHEYRRMAIIANPNIAKNIESIEPASM